MNICRTTMASTNSAATSITSTPRKSRSIGYPKEEWASESQTDSESRGRGDSEARGPIMLVPLTGRDSELSLLKDRWEQAQEAMGQVVLAIEEAGLGKSRLVQTLAQRVKAHGSDAALIAADESARASVDQDSALIEWRCSEQFQNSELYPVIDYLERFLGRGRDASPTSRFERLARHLDSYELGRSGSVNAISRRKRMGSGSGCRSAAQSSRRTAARSTRRTTRSAERRFTAPCH